MHISKLEEKIKVRFLDKTLLSLALGTSSKVKKSLELIGDAVLDTAVIDYIQKCIPDGSCGEFTRLKQSYVNNRRLIQVAVELGMHEFSELNSGKALANTLEALIGAIYRDQGYETAKLFIFNCLLPPEKELREIKDLQKIKQECPIHKIVPREKAEKQYDRIPNQEIALREKVKEHYNVMPYMLVERGDEKVTFQIYAQGKCIATGNGKSEKQARKNAIDLALKKIEIKKHSMNPK